MLRQMLPLLLVFAFAVSCEAEPPRFMYAPDDLKSALPTQVGDLTLEVEGSGGSEYLVEALGEDALTALTRCHSNARCHHDRVHFALASSSSDPDAPRLVVFAARVEDVGAWNLGPGAETSVHYPADAGVTRYFAQDIAAPGEGWLLLYPYGEVLFGAIATSDELTVTSDDLVAAFPSCRQMAADYVRSNCVLHD